MNNLYAAVIHDVKNQLAELALRLERRADAQQEAELAMNAARRLSGMLLAHREASGLLQANADAASPADMLAILAAEYRELFPALAIEIDAGRAPACAFFDDALVRLALANALHNACRHARLQVRLAAYAREGMLVFEVSDDGPGFPDSVLTAMAESPSAPSRSGTGLGLYLARKIAGLHQLQGRHGAIELSNSPGGYFRMLLP